MNGEPVMPERKIHRERLEAIRDWHLPKYSTGVHVSRDETVQMASRVLAAEAIAAEQYHAASQLAEAFVRLEAKVAEQATTIAGLEEIISCDTKIIDWSQPRIESLRLKVAEQAATIADQAKELKVLRRVPDGEVWYWQGDGEDFPESLTCPVIMSAATCRDMVRQAATVERLTELTKKAHKALKDLATEEIIFSWPSEYWTETDCPGDQMWDTIHLIDAALSK